MNLSQFSEKIQMFELLLSLLELQDNFLLIDLKNTFALFLVIERL